MKRGLKKIKNSKGFTLVELLVSFVILGIISGISIPLVRNAQSNGYEKKYKTYAESLLNAAKLYNDSYSEDLFGNLEYGCNYITYQQLESKNLVKDIQMDGVSCNSDNTFIRVIKMKDKYVYKYYLGCGNKKSDGTAESVTKAVPGPSKHEMDSDLCGGVNGSNISVTVDPPFGGSKYDAQTRNAKIILKSAIPIRKDPTFSIKYKWVWTYNDESKSTSFKKAFDKTSIPEIGTQYTTLETADFLEFTYNIVTPHTDKGYSIKANGDVHLIIQVENLKDENGVSWVNTYDFSSNQFDVNNNTDNTKTYKVDNDPPYFVEDPKIESKVSTTHSKDTIITFKAGDKLAPDDIKYCVTEKSSCNDSDFHKYKDGEKIEYSFDSYDGKEKTVNVFIKDSAGNEAKKSVKYTLAKTYTLTYDSNGGVACSPNKKDVQVVDGINSTWGELCKPHYNNHQFLGWNTKRDGSGDTIDKDSKVTKNLTVYAQWRKSHVIFRIQLPEGDTITPATTSSDGRYRYKWTYDTADGAYYYVYKSVNDGASSVYKYEIDYDATTMDLPDYNNQYYINITRGSSAAYSGKEWKCTNCKTNGQVFSQRSSSIDPSSVCDTKNGDCKVTLRVNWNESKVKIKMNANGGSMATPHGAAYTISGGKILKNGGEVIHEITYGSKLDDNGLLDYNNSTYLNVKRDGYHVDSGSEWNTKADGTGTTYSQSVAYNGSDFCNASSGDCTTTLYLNWKENSYTVKYVLGGGSGSFPDQAKSHGTNVKLHSNKPTMSNYTFTGWNTKADGSGTAYGAGATYSKNESVTLYAQYRKNQVIFQYKINSGETLRSDTVADDGERYKWTKSSNLVYKSVNGAAAEKYVQKWNFDANSINLANYDNPKYLHISKTGATGVVGSEWKCVNGCIDSSQKFTDEIINGINLANVCNFTNADCTVTLAVNWKSNTYAVTYNSTGGDPTPGPQDKIHGADLTLTSTIPKKEHYKFNGWNTKANGSGDSYAAGATYTKNEAVTLYAQWVPNKVIFNIRIDDETVKAVTYRDSDTYRWKKGADNLLYRAENSTTNYVLYKNVYDYNSPTINLPNYNGSYLTISKSGYVAVSSKEWICYQGCSGTFSQDEDTAANLANVCDSRNGDCSVVIKVNWQPNTYKVTYDANGGTGAPGTQTKTHGVSLTLSNTKPTQSSYTFMSWHSTKDGGYYSPGSSYTANADTTMKAFWCSNCNAGANAKCSLDTTQKSTCKYTTSCDDGYTYESGQNTNKPKCKKVLSMYNILYYDGTSQLSGLSPNMYTGGISTTVSAVPTKSGYTFNGWSKDSASATPKFSHKIETSETGTKKFYAKWCGNCNPGANANCTLNASTAGTCNYTTSCKTGYIYESGENTATPKCKENRKRIIYYDADRSTEIRGLTPDSFIVGETAFINGKTGGSARPADKDNMLFNGWQTAGNTKSWTFNVSADAKKDVKLFSMWCLKCSPGAHAHCSLNRATVGKCKYTTSCDSGYEYKSGEGDYNPVCVKNPKVSSILYYDNDGSTIINGLSPTQYTEGAGAIIDGDVGGNARPSKSGKKFAGWSWSSGAKKGDYVKSISTAKTGTQMLYAVWCNSSQSIVEDSDGHNYCVDSSSDIPSSLCDYSEVEYDVGAELFGTLPDQVWDISNRRGGAISDSENWPAWCMKGFNGAKCRAKAYNRFCYNKSTCGSAYGHTASYINNLLASNGYCQNPYYKYWCYECLY